MSAQYALVCYRPDQAAVAKHRLAVKPLDPSRAVSQYTGLTLSYLQTGRHILPSRNPRITLLYFAYGSVPDLDLYPTVTPETGPWMSVTEFAPPFQKMHGIVVRATDVLGAKWALDEELFQHHKVHVFIETNGDKATLRRIGRELLREDKSG